MWDRSLSETLRRIMMLNDLIKWDGSGRATLPIRVTPKASSNRIRIEQHPTGPCVRVDVTVAPEDGKANKQVIKLLAKEMRMPKSALTIKHGFTNRDKIIAFRKT